MTVYLGLSGRDNDREERWAQREEERIERMVQKLEAGAAAAYPALPLEEAVPLYKRQREAGEATAEFLEQYWPVIGAVVVGVLLLSFLPSRRRSRR